MHRMHERLVTMLTLLFVALAVSQGQPPALLAAGIAVVAVGMLVGARYVAVAVHSREITVGQRARQHRESLSDVAAPRHPSTPGRRRSRAPSVRLAAA